MTARRAALLAACGAVVAYAPAPWGGFTLDDTPIVEQNPRAHSVAAAIAAFDEPYWPPPHDAGQWRPLVILSFAADWQLSGGNTAWLHAANVLWHATATALLVWVLLPYAGVMGACAGALLFAVHPVHVEAVANLVGRAEPMVAVFVLLAVLASRAASAAAAAGLRTWPAELAALVSLALGLLTKEHAAVTVALVALDDRARPAATGRVPSRTLGAMVLLTAAWLIARGAVEGGQSFVAVAPTFLGLGVGGRLSTMMPVVFDVVRLLVWPFALSPDYHPQVVPRLEGPTLLAALGATLLAAIAALAIATWRRHRTVSAALWIVGITWLPTANLLFPSGIVLAERTLYLPSVGVALLAGVAVNAGMARRRPIAMAVAAAIALAFAARTITRVPVWWSSRDLVVDGVLHRPESYKVRQAAARVYMKTNQIPQALREYSLAAELFDRDPWLLTEAGSAALAGGRPRLAVRFLERSQHLDSNYTLTRQLLARARAEVASSPAGTLR